MPTMRIRFPGGRYHATPWGHHVNEGLIEWPPCPWRLLRALIATGYSKLGWAGDVPDVGRRLIETLAGTLPRYRLPPAGGAHSRHYMPVGTLDQGREKTTLVFDTWANVGDGALLIQWDCVLDEEAMALFDRLIEHMSYLGRSESWIEAQAVDDQQIGNDFNAYPHTDGHHPGRGWEQVSLLVAESASAYAAWRGDAVESARAEYPLPQGQKKPDKKLLANRQKAEAPYPADLLDCLQKDTAWWKGHKWSQPPGSRRVIYWRQADALQVSPPIQLLWPPVRQVTAMLLALTTASDNKSALPHVTRTLPQAELLHAALVSRVGNGQVVNCPELTGKDEHGHPLRGGHQHAHILPLDLDGDQHLDHLLVYAPLGLGDAAQHAVRTLKRTWTKGGVGDLQLALAGQGSLDDLRNLPAPLSRRIERLLGPAGGARRWRSMTPFVPPRHEKQAGKRNDLADQVNAELVSRRLPPAQAKLLPWNDTTRSTGHGGDSGPGYCPEDRPRDDATRMLRHYMRRRRLGGDAPPRDVGYAIELAFSEPVPGPIILGYGCHFGLGLFASVEPREGG